MSRSGPRNVPKLAGVMLRVTTVISADKQYRKKAKSNKGSYEKEFHLSRDTPGTGRTPPFAAKLIGILWRRWRRTTFSHGDKPARNRFLRLSGPWPEQRRRADRFLLRCFRPSAARVRLQPGATHRPRYFGWRYGPGKRDQRLGSDRGRIATPRQPYFSRFLL